MEQERSPSSGKTMTAPKYQRRLLGDMKLAGRIRHDCNKYLSIINLINLIMI
jgi:hypothetical protein